MLSGVYLKVFRLWLSDNDTGMAKTMALLNSELEVAEKWAIRTNKFVEKSKSIFKSNKSGSCNFCSSQHSKKENSSNQSEDTSDGTIRNEKTV